MSFGKLGYKYSNFDRGSGSSGGVGPTPPTSNAFAMDGALNPIFLAVNTAQYDPNTNKTWIAYQATDGVNLVVHVTVYDHAAHSWSPIYEAGISIATTFLLTDHGVPNIVRDADGYWHVFFGTWYNNSLQHAVTTNPDDPSAWTQLANIGNTSTDCPGYPCGIMIGSTMYLFYQNTLSSNTGRTLLLRKSTSITAGVVTFGAPVTIADVGAFNMWYPSNYILRGTDIWFTGTRALGQQSFQWRDQVYVCRYDTLTGNVKNVDASVTTLAANLPINAATLTSSYAAVVPGGTNAGVIATLAFDGNNKPNILYASGASTVNYFNPYSINVIQFTGGAWVVQATGLGTTNANFNSVALITEADGSLTAYWPQTNATLQAAGIKNGGDIATAHCPLNGAWGARSIIQVAGQSSGSFANPSGPYPMEVVPVTNCSSGLQAIFTEVVPGAALSSSEFGRLNLYAYGSSGYVGSNQTLYQSNATAGLLAKFVTQPSASRAAIIDNAMFALQSSGLFTNYKAYYVYAAHSAQAALVSWVPPKVTSLVNISQNLGVVHGSPTFTVDQGYQGNGTSDYITTAGLTAPYAKDSASIWAWCMNTTSNNTLVTGTGTGANPWSTVGYTGATTAVGRIQTTNATTVSGSVIDQTGLLLIDRTGANATTLYKNATPIATDATGSSAVPAGAPTVLADQNNSTFSNQLVAAEGFGASLGGTNASSHYDILNSYLQAVAAGPGFPPVNYYVSAAGSDANPGTISQPWLTASKVNSVTLAANTTVHFRGGDTFTGSLVVSNSGAVGQPIVFTSYGTGRPTIVPTNTNTDGILIVDQSNITIKNINVTGPGTVGTGTAIYFSAITANCSNITVTNCNLSSVGGSSALTFGGDAGSFGFSNVVVNGVNSFSNKQSGLGVYGSTSNGHTNNNVVISNCTFHDNGASGAFVGNTLNTHAVDGNGNVTYGITAFSNCVSYNNGTLVAGGAGIWTYESSGIRIANCESYTNSSTTSTNGDGFALDASTIDGTIEYCYSHGNKGAGFRLLSGNFLTDNNTFRYNISESNCTNTAYGEFTVIKNGSTSATNFRTYNNSFYNGATSVSIMSLQDASISGKLANNIIYAATNPKLATVTGNPASVLFVGNDWFSTGTFTITWNGVTYTSYATWQTATSQEKISGSDVGSHVDPQLGAPGGGTAASYKLAGTSPVIANGLNLNSQYSTNVGSLDYFGNVVSSGGTFSIGAAGPVSTYTSAFYVAVSGSDSNLGTLASPWATITKVNAQTFAPGTIVFFKGGDSFLGGLIIPASGTAASPIQITSYGTGTATITTGAAGIAIKAQSKGGIKINNINLGGVSASTGIQLYNGTGAQLDYIDIENVNMTGYAAGIDIEANTGSGSTAFGFTNVTIKNVSIGGATNVGIFMNGSSTNLAHGNVTIDTVNVAGHGDGIDLWNCNTGLINNCTVHDSAAKNSSCAIQVQNATAITVQNCEVFNQASSLDGFDANGIDFDVNCTNCIAQYNFVRGCAGAGFSMFQTGGAGWSNNTLRWNITQSNGIGTSNVKSELWIGAGGTESTCNVYNNTFYSTAANPIIASADSTTTGTFANNIFYAAGASTKLLSVVGNPTIAFTGNDYYAPSGFSLVWNGVTYTSYAAWQTATSQEKIGGVDVGLSADPVLSSPGGSTALSYKIGNTSPVITAGIDLNAQYSFNVGPQDYFGSTPSPLGPFSMGAAGPFSTAGLLVTVFLTTPGTGTWTVPANFVTLSSVECIAGGGGNNASNAGGGGGAYAKITSTTTPLVAGTTVINVGVGAGGSSADGGDTWWNATSLANAAVNGSAISVGAEHGKTNVVGTGGAGGLAANSVGTVKFNGGNAGNTSGATGGGGGAAGLRGPGANGSNGVSGTVAGAGGGNGGGYNGSLGSGTTGGNGGYGYGYSGRGAGGSSTFGSNGTNGGGGGGAGVGGRGGTGGNGIEWDASHGSGGGGGAGIGSNPATGNGGLYGGGAGGRNAGLGGQGIIVIKYQST